MGFWLLFSVCFKHLFSAKRAQKILTIYFYWIGKYQLLQQMHSTSYKIVISGISINSTCNLLRYLSTISLYSYLKRSPNMYKSLQNFCHCAFYFCCSDLQDKYVQGKVWFVGFVLF